MECTGDWTDTQKKKNGERREACAGDWTDMQRKMERRRERIWGLDRHAEKNGQECAGGWTDMQRKMERGETERESGDEGKVGGAEEDRDK